MKGYEQVRSKLQRLPDTLTKAGADGLREVGTKIFNQSQAIVPYDTGNLKASGSMTESGGSTKLKITIGYYEDYAVFVHEILYYNHPHGRAKFLEEPFNDNISGIESTIASKVRGAL